MKLSTHDLSGIEYIDFHTHKQMVPESSLSVLSVEYSDLQDMALESSERLYLSVGLHPWRMPQDTDFLDEHIDKIRKMLFIPEVIALGEVGLDRLHGPDLRIQKAYLAELFRIAAESDETIIVHCVRCYPELMALKKKFAPHQKMLIHGFNSKIKLLNSLVKDGFYVSLCPKALQREDLCAFIREKSEILRHICLETDDSPLTIKNIYDLAARALKIEITELSLFMKANFIALFQGTINE